MPLNYGTPGKPTLGGSLGSWGSTLNTALDTIKTFVDGLETSIAATVLKAGDTLTGLLNLKTVTQAHVTVASNPATVLDLSAADSFDTTVNSATTFTFSVPAGFYPVNTLAGFILRITNGGSAATTWPASVKWPGGSAPALTAAGVDLLVFLSDNGGVTWRGALAAADVK